MSEKNKSKDWNIYEKIVAIIEQQLDPEANVEQDVKLPVIGSPSGAKRQCDIVIRQGRPPRETISIVEAQKRGRKVEINEFSGWLTKRDEVGAQHLICVSEKGYPISVKEKAEKEGPSV